jgi:hypothetical protein
LRRIVYPDVGIMGGDSSGAVTIERNVFARIGGWGTYLTDSPNSRIVGNTYTSTGFGSVVLTDDPNNSITMAGVVALNNVFDKLAGWSSMYAVEDYNLTASGIRNGAHDVAGSPTFVDAAGGDFRLAEGSLGIDAGTSDGTPLLDRLGIEPFDDPAVPNSGGGVVPFVDIGADERWLRRKGGGGGRGQRC